MAHALSTHLGTGDLHTAAVTDNAFIANPFVFAAMALPVTGWSKDLFAKESFPLRFQGSIVNRFRLPDFSMRPLTDHRRRSQTNTHPVKIVDV
ncbi:hypothetical protein HMPREF0322_01294 [Desulfitobacterium hafniense DP7]|uniref:Uncharacterized protein n=1 Tax=Desulfitobacterium hafniense DP7 TaxID=537010 RepID=G9XK14_DESHA|nr:hypothetical protein HMPREF0322_01294 [Desulfitobacterium hafniense DP7]